MTVIMVDFSNCPRLKLRARAGVGGTLAVTLTLSGAPVVITGAAIKYYAALALPITKQIASGITITNGPLGQFSIQFNEVDTSGQNTEQVVEHECRIQLIGGQPAMVFDGLLMLERAIFSTM